MRIKSAKSHSAFSSLGFEAPVAGTRIEGGFEICRDLGHSLVIIGGTGKRRQDAYLGPLG
jgi:hypothetical protein